VMQNNKVVYLNKVDGNHHVHLLSHAGKQNPIHCTSSGKVLLAFQQEAAINQILDMGLQKYTPNTISSKAKMKELLTDIRRKGFSYSKEELHVGVSSIAAPIKRISGEVIAAVSIAGPTSRINQQNIHALSKFVQKAADDISYQLVFRKKEKSQTKR
jgi:IclR family transcriptional regulator, KDG regulon repressor